jgi:hypothetical protein
MQQPAVTHNEAIAMPRKLHSEEAQEPKFLMQPQVTCNPLQTFPPPGGSVGLETSNR